MHAKRVVTAPFMAIILMITAALLQGCAGSGEDVHIAYCKNLTLHLLGAPEGLTWQVSSTEIHRPEYAEIKVNFTHPEDGAGEASCFYDYIAVDETAQTLADPLSAYATVPYKMTLQGQPVSKQELANAISADMERVGRAITTPPAGQ